MCLITAILGVRCHGLLPSGEVELSPRELWGLSRLPLPYPEPCTLPEPILVCLELWKSLCPNVLSLLLSPPFEHLSSAASSGNAGCHRGTPAAPPGTACF